MSPRRTRKSTLTSLTPLSVVCSVASSGTATSRVCSKVQTVSQSSAGGCPHPLSLRPLSSWVAVDAVAPALVDSAAALVALAATGEAVTVAASAAIDEAATAASVVTEGEVTAEVSAAIDEAVTVALAVIDEEATVALAMTDEEATAVLAAVTEAAAIGELPARNSTSKLPSPTKTASRQPISVYYFASFPWACAAPPP